MGIQSKIGNSCKLEFFGEVPDTNPDLKSPRTLRRFRLVNSGKTYGMFSPESPEAVREEEENSVKLSDLRATLAEEPGVSVTVVD